MREPAPTVRMTRAETRVRRVVAGVLGAEERIAAIAVSPSPFTGVWPADTVTVTLDDGRLLALRVKRLPAGGHAHPDKARRDREPRVYAELLQRPGLPVPRFYGWMEDPETRELLLVLEQVQDWDLRYHGLETWAVAVRGLARLHARFAHPAGVLDDHDFLLRIDGDYVRRWAARAGEALARAGVASRRRLDDLHSGSASVAALIGDQPPTLIHNDLAPKNVVADTAVHPPRTCIVDWETAGVSCAILDLAHLLYGLDVAEAERLAAVYREEAPELLPGGAEGERLLAACRAHKAMFRLAHPALWAARPALVPAWLDEIERDVRVL